MDTSSPEGNYDHQDDAKVKDTVMDCLTALVSCHCIVHTKTSSLANEGLLQLKLAKSGAEHYLSIVSNNDDYEDDDVLAQGLSALVRIN